METSIAYILDNIEQYKQMLKNRFLDDSVIDKIELLHKKSVDILIEKEKTSQLRNIVSNLINKQNEFNSVEFDFNSEINPSNLVKQDMSIYTKESLITLGRILKVKFTEQDKLHAAALVQRNTLVNTVPNLLHSLVPIFESEENNKIIKVYNAFDSDSNSSSNAKLFNQYELCCKLGILEEAGEIAGHRGYFLVNEGVRLNYALINYALDFLEQRQYKLMYTPHFMKKEKIEQVCQLSEFEETLYEIKDSDLFLIATSEQPMTAYFADKQLNNLPIKMCGLSTCFRKEAGKHGKDTLGIFRVHQFEKVEQFCVTTPDKSWAMMEEMCNTAQDFFKSLGISYRVVNIVSKELNNAAAMKYDIEGLFRGTGLYKELVSCSNTTDYFSRRIKTKCASKEFAHLLNSTLCANTRTLCCLLETHQVEDGVTIPEVLRSYYNKDKIMFK